MNPTSDLFESSAREAVLREEDNFSTTHRDGALAGGTQTERNLSTGGRRLGNNAELPFESQGDRADLALGGLGLEPLWDALGALDFEFGTANEYKSVARWQESISTALLNSDDPMDLLDWGIQIFEQLSGRQITFAMFRDWLGPRLPDTTRSLLNACRNRGSLQMILAELLRASGRLMEIRNSVLTTIFQERQARTWAEFRSMLKRTFFKVFVLTIADQAPLALGTDVWTSWCFARLPEPIRVFLLHKIQVQQFTLAPLLSQAFSIHYLADTKPTAVAYPVLQPDPLPRGACHSCGKLGHKRAACPDKDATCESCGKRGHTETACIRTKLRGSMKALDAELKPTRTGFNLGFKTKLTDRDEMAAGYNYFNKRLQPTNRITEVEMVPESGRSFVGMAATRKGRVQTIRGGIGRLGDPTIREIELTLDGGAEVSLISEQIADEFADVIEPSTQDVYGVGGERQLDRKLDLLVDVGGRQEPVTFHVLPGLNRVLVGYEDQIRLDLDISLPRRTVKAIGGREVPLLEVYHVDLRDNAAWYPHEVTRLQEALNQNCSYRVADVQPVHLELSREVPRQPIRPLNERLVQVAKEVIPPLLKQRLIEPAAKGTIISPAHFVTKRDGTWRLVIDYRLVNAATVSAHHPLPNIEQILHSLRECKWFSKLDLKNGFWNVPLDESSKNLTGFSVGRLGCYRWNVLPQGHKCAPAEFQQRVEDVLRNLMDAEVVRVYVDDIIIGTKTRDAHLGLVLRVLERLREVGLRISREKCEFLKTELSFLGVIVTHNTLTPDPKRVSALSNAPIPKDQTELKRFVGAVQYISRHIPNLGEFLSPISPWLKKGSFKVTPDFERHFRSLKLALADTVSLTMPDPQEGFLLFTDASNVAAGAALWQPLESPKLIACLSHTFSTTERNWSTTERECYAIVWALEKLHNIIKGSEVVVFTDHKALEHLDSTNNAKLSRWRARICEFTVTFHYTAGSSNIVADWLSRLDSDHDQTIDTIAVPAFIAIPPPVSAEDLRSEPPAPEDIPFLTETPNGRVHTWSRARYIPPKHRDAILFLLHGSPHSGHAGLNRCLRLARRVVWWKGLAKDLKRHIQECLSCTLHRTQPIHRHTTRNLHRPVLGEIISVDHIIMSKSGDGRILVVIDHATRFMMASFAAGGTCAGAADFLLTRWVPTLGFPRVVLSDNHPFEGLGKYLQVHGVEHYRCASYYPQGNGLNESSHRFINHCSATNRDASSLHPEVLLSMAVFAHNSTPHEGLGCSPICCLTGMEPRMIGWQQLETENESQRRVNQVLGLQCRLSLAALEQFHDSGSLDRQPKVGEVVTFPLDEIEARAYRHLSGLTTIRPKNAIPHRIVGITHATATLSPVWYDGKPISRPISTLRSLGSSIPEEHRATWELLYSYDRKRRTRSLTRGQGGDGEVLNKKCPRVT